MVATIAGVSASSASRALNHQAGRPETVRRVVEAAESIGYRPNSAARSLRLRRTEQIALAVPDIANPAYTTLMRAIQDVIGRENYRLVVYAAAHAAEAVEVVRMLAYNHVDGLIIVPIRMTEELATEVRAAALPVVVVGTVSDDLGVDYVRTDSRHGARLVVEHLLATGRRRVAFVGAAGDTNPGRMRLQGYRETLRAARVPFDSALVVSGQFDMASGAESVRILAERGVGFDALFCANDLVAIGAMHELRRRGLVVPKDVAVVGMDNSDLGAVYNPSLTSVSMSADMRGHMAAGMMLTRLHEPGSELQRLTVEPSLHVRESSATATNRQVELTLVESRGGR
jgi:LacI family transcriptional regulator